MSIEINDITLILKQGDITEQTTDAIVNAANSHLAHGGGVAAAIAQKAGKQLIDASNNAPEIPTGQVFTTTAGNLSAKYVIHAVGPIWRGGGYNEDQLLHQAVINSLREADRLKLQSISLPAISTGIYGFPITRAAIIILETIVEFCTSQNSSLKTIAMILFSRDDFEIFNTRLKRLST